MDVKEVGIWNDMLSLWLKLRSHAPICIYVNVLELLSCISESYGQVLSHPPSVLCSKLLPTQRRELDGLGERERERHGKREWMDITSPDRVTVTSKSWMVEAILALHRTSTQKDGKERRDRSSQSLW